MKSSSRFARLLALVVLLSLGSRAGADVALFQIRAVAELTDKEGEIFPLLKEKGAIESIAVEPTAWLDDTAIKSAKALKPADGGLPSVILTLTEAGTERWTFLTAKYTGRRLAIFLGGHLVSAPTIGQPLRGSKIEISGGFSEKEAVELAEKLNAQAGK